MVSDRNNEEEEAKLECTELVLVMRCVVLCVCSVLCSEGGIQPAVRGNYRARRDIK